MSRITLENIHFTSRHFTLHPLSLEVEKGEFFVLLGHSGSGKTFLLESIAGLRKVGGTIRFDGKDMSSTAPEQRNVGFIYQDFALFPHLNVKQNILFSTNYKKSPDSRMLFERIITFLDIEKLIDRPITNLSGGEKQRITIARALMAKPNILLLDEPLSAIDPSLRSSIMHFLRNIHREFHVTTLYVTHNFREASFLADRIGILLDGRLLQVGAPNETLKKPINGEVAQFLGHKNIFSAHLIAPHSEKKQVSIDPNMIELSVEKPMTDYVFSGTITGIDEIIDHVNVYLHSDVGEFFVKLPMRLREKISLHVNETLFIGFNERDIWFL